MGQRDDGGVDVDEAADLIAELGALCRKRAGRE
jgi:hypothetical protein